MKESVVTSAAAAVLVVLMAACSGGDDSGPGKVGAIAGEAGKVTVDQVVDAVEAAGLPIVNPRDNTAGLCDPADPQLLACDEVLTTDLFTIWVWDTPADASHRVEVAIGPAPVMVGDRTTVDFHDGGTTPAYDRAAYQQALVDLEAAGE